MKRMFNKGSSPTIWRRKPENSRYCVNVPSYCPTNNPFCVGRKFSRGGGKNSSPPSKGGGDVETLNLLQLFHAESVAGSVGLSLQTRGFAHGWIAPADKNGLQCIYESPQKIIVRLACWWWVPANCGPPNFHRQVLRDGNSSFCSISSGQNGQIQVCHFSVGKFWRWLLGVSPWFFHLKLRFFLADIAATTAEPHDLT